MRGRLVSWATAGLLVLGCGGMDSLGEWAVDDERGLEESLAPIDGCFADDVEELPGPEVLEPPEDLAESIGPAAAAASASATSVFIVERLDDDDGEPLLSDEFLDGEDAHRGGE